MVGPPHRLAVALKIIIQVVPTTSDVIPPQTALGHIPQDTLNGILAAHHIPAIVIMATTILKLT